MSENQINSSSENANEVHTTPLEQGTIGTSPTGPHARSGASSPPHTNIPHSTFFSSIYRRFMFPSSKAAREYVAKKAPLAIPSVLLTLLGFKQLPQSIPLLNFIKDHRVASPIIGAVMVLLFVAALLISFYPPPQSEGGDNAAKQGTGWRMRPWVIATGMSTTSFVLSSALLVIVLIRPAWCPNALCVAPQPLIYGPHDANLEVNFIAMQSPAYVLSKDPSQYSLRSKNLPRSTEQSSIGATRVDAKAPTSAYLVVLNIHNLRSQGYSMLLEDVDLVVKQTPSTPYPLNVWLQPPPIVYQSVNHYSVAYSGEAANAVIPAAYVRLPGGNAQLNPLETDSLLLQVTPRVLAATDLRFGVQITYRFANEARRYTFTPPYTFEVVFAKASNWHPYQLQGGRLVKVKT